MRSLLVFISDCPLSPGGWIRHKSGACLKSRLWRTEMSADGGTNGRRLKIYLTVRNAVLRKNLSPERTPIDLVILSLKTDKSAF